MIIKCIYNSGKDLRKYEFVTLGKGQLGRFETTEYTQFGIEINKEYLVMGMIWGQGALVYLIDDDGHVSAYPYPLFEVVDSKLPPNWYFKQLKNTDDNYPYQETIWGYYELVNEENHYEKLVEGEEEAMRTYFRRRIELEKESEE